MGKLERVISSEGFCMGVVDVALAAKTGASVAPVPVLLTVVELISSKMAPASVIQLSD